MYFSIYVILQSVLGQPLAEMSSRSRKIMFLVSQVRTVRRADNLAAICLLLTVNRLSRQYGVLNISQPYSLNGPLRGQLYFFSYFLGLCDTEIVSFVLTEVLCLNSGGSVLMQER
jgi:hypothetical protein